MEINMMDYLMGLMMADGWVRRHETVSGEIRRYPGIEMKDKDLLEKIAMLFEGKVEYRKRGKTNMYRLYFPVDFFPHAELIDTGRSGIYDYFNTEISNQESFIRGFFDGDGGVCVRHTKGYPYLSVYFTIGAANLEVKKVLDSWLSKHNFKFSIYFDERGSGAWNYNLSKKSEVERFYKTIYQGSPDLYLERKYLIFVANGFPKMETF